MPVFETLLVVNRGEIARRVMRTAREMGIRSVAVYVDADRDAPFVRDADVAMRIETSYLDGEAALEAARRSGAGAIHPGYGFLSENAAFARAVEEAGLAWVGPSPEAIEVMGDKLTAKDLAESSGVPTLPMSADTTADGEVGYPLLVKAAAGGGGKGMRVVESPEDLEQAVAAAQREAKTGFGDDRVFLERFVATARHIEIQILGDAHGNLVHLGERDCSIQRRHQKIIEESPSPRVDAVLRERMGQAALGLGRSLGYRSAGTVEFLFDDKTREFWFLEVNTRLQVEHPVTEMVTGIDLVREQLRVARGEPLDFTQEDITFTGSAVEARLYAEDPANNFLPVTGTIATLDTSDAPPVRWDSGVESGSVVGISFDPMLAKVIAHGPNRTEASSRLALSLERTHLAGMRTNRDFLVNVLRTPEFLEGDTTTDFIPRVDPPRELVLDDAARDLGFHLATLFTQAGAGPGATGSVAFDFRNERFEISYAVLDDGEWEFGNGTIARVHSRAPDRLDAEVGGVRFRSMITQVGPELFVQTPSGDLAMTLAPMGADTPAEAAGPSAMEAVALAAYGVHRHRGQRVRTVPSSTPWEIAGRLEQLARSQ